MINLEAGQVWRSKRDADNARRIISVTNKLQSLMIEYIRNGETVVEIGTSFRRWIDISGATLVEGQ